MVYLVESNEKSIFVGQMIKSEQLYMVQTMKSGPLINHITPLIFIDYNSKKSTLLLL